MSDRPPLRPIALEQLERAAKKIDADYWHALKALQVDYRGPETLSPPKTPQLLLNCLQMYAGALFRLEEPNYTQGASSYGLWLAALGNRITARILRTVEEVESGSENGAKLSYHGLTVDAARQGLETFLAAVVDECVWKASLPVPSELPGPQKSITEAPATDADHEIARRSLLLAEYKAATYNVSNKRIYEARNSGIHKPEFYRWVSGDLPSTSTPARKFERFLAAKKMPIPRKFKS